MSQTMQTSLQPRKASAAWTGWRVTAIDLLRPTGPPLGRPAAMARLDAARRTEMLPAPTRRSRLGPLPR